MTSLFFANILGFISIYRKWFVLGGAVVAVFVLVVVISKCGGRPPIKLNEAEIQRAEQAIAERNRKELEEILTDADVREKQIDKTLANGRTETINAIAESRKRYQEMTTEELAAEFERRK